MSPLFRKEIKSDKLAAYQQAAADSTNVSIRVIAHQGENYQPIPDKRVPNPKPRTVIPNHLAIEIDRPEGSDLKDFYQRVVKNQG